MASRSVYGAQAARECLDPDKGKGCRSLAQIADSGGDAGLSFEQYLAEMDAELAKAGLTGEIVLCGGAVMACVCETGPSTKDVDALFAPTRELRDIAARIAEEHGLEENGLNDTVKAFINTSRMRFETVAEMPALKVMRSDDAGMLAMKLASAQEGSKDA